MHRSGTSAIARGLHALSVDLGDNFFALAPDNPTGYWEDKAIVALNQRVLEELRLKWDDTALLAPERFTHYRIRLLKLQAQNYLRSTFGSKALWGFKDPRTIRLLPFWRAVLRDLPVEDCYVVAIRHPRSVAASLFARQEIDEEKAQRLWLVHHVPFLHEIRDKPWIVVDYDLFTAQPRAQLERTARKLRLPPIDAAIAREIDRFAGDFLDVNLRHTVFETHDFNATTGLGRLTEAAYHALYDLAVDRVEAPSAAFWSQWETIAAELRTLLHTA